MKILLVEDSPTQALATCQYLESHGFKVSCVDSLERCLSILKNSVFEAILLDLSLPDGSGMELFLTIRAKAGNVPIVIYTVSDNPAKALEFVKSGAQDYLVKEIASEDSIERCLRYAIERNKLDLEQRKIRERLSTILENSYDGFLSVDSTWRVRDWNLQAEQAFGIAKSSALGKSFDFIFPAHLRRKYMQDIRNHFEHKTGPMAKISRELTALHKDGHEFPVELGIFKIQEDNDYMFCAFIRDISDKIYHQEKLERLVHERTEKLTASNEELRCFAKITSHDLQEPLRAMQGFATLLAENTAGKLDPESMDFVNYIVDGAERLKQLIQSVLAHSQLDRQPTIDVSTDCNLVVSAVLEGLKSQISESGASLEIDPLPEVAVERSQLSQLFQNLLSNSLKYRGLEPPVISISADWNVHEWLFSVRDNGIGIDPRYSDKIFDMFSRLHAKNRFPGTGMGLAICKKVVTAHGGNIWVDSKLGHGSIFLFTLPAVKHSRRGKMKEIMNILLVEDTPSDIRLTEEALKRSSLTYNLSIVNDGVEAIDYLTGLADSQGSVLPDVILLDLNMPKMNGHEVMEALSKHATLKKIPVVVLTVSERDEDVREALRLKMNFYLAKPVSTEKVSALLNAIQDLHSVSGVRSEDHYANDNHVKLILAGNPHTTEIALRRLAEDPSERIRSRVAQHPSLPKELIAKLSTDPHHHVRLSVSENVKAPVEILKNLAADVDINVRLGLAKNGKLPATILQTLADDENIYVSTCAKRVLVEAKES